MNSFILLGVVRGLGGARIKFDLAYRSKKTEDRKLKRFQFLENLDLKDKEFSRTALFKTLKFFHEDEFDEVLFWTLLKLINAEEIGGICFPKVELIQFIQKKNSNLNPENSWKKYFEAKNEFPLLREDGGMIYLTHLYETEVSVCNYLQLFFEGNSSEKFIPYKDKNLSEEQVSIVNSLFKNSISFLSGGPGTGKTTMIQAILKFGIQNGILPEEIGILAPTGKAAKRLNESCRQLLNEISNLQPASTIHRFLGYNPSSGKFKFNYENPIDKKLLIIDESSMVDIFLLKAILAAFQNPEKNKRLILVGDSNQLLSVNSGSVFSDFIHLNKNVFKLTESFRQTKEGEEIKSLATKILMSSDKNITNFTLDGLEIRNDLKETSTGVYFIETNSDEDSLKLTLEWYRNLKSNQYSGQILSPYNETKIGVKNLNLFLQNELKKASLLNAKIPVIVSSNLYDLELFNGESGYLIETATETKFIHSEKEEISLSSSYLQYFELGYAITIHKSQGSEYDHICILIPSELEIPDLLLNIRILYTAITRAKKSVTLIGSSNLFAKALLTTGEKRHSQIQKRL